MLSMPHNGLKWEYLEYHVHSALFDDQSPLLRSIAFYTTSLCCPMPLWINYDHSQPFYLKDWLQLCLTKKLAVCSSYYYEISQFFRTYERIEHF